MEMSPTDAKNFPEAVWRAWREYEEAKTDGRPRFVFAGNDGKSFHYRVVWFPRRVRQLVFMTPLS